MHYPLVVLGGGPGGYASAFMAADQGLDVVIVEADGQLGGTCLLRGCIPSKALLHVAHVVEQAQEVGDAWGVHYEPPSLDLEKLRAKKSSTIGMLAKGLGMLAKSRKVQVIQGRGSFAGSAKLRIEGEHPSVPEGGSVTFDHCIVATGSQPALPGVFDIGSSRVMDSTSALEINDLPPRLLVVGGGYIGLELGTVYARLGTQVTIAEKLPRLLDGVDKDLLRPLERRLKKELDQRIYVETEVRSLTETADGLVAEFVGKHEAQETFDKVLVAVGRKPNSARLGLENTAVQTDAHGFIECNQRQQTSDSGIYAVGDVSGQPMLAHRAIHQARVAVANIVGRETTFAPAAIPAVVFTDPEIAWAGLTQAEAKATGQAVEVAAYPWAASGKAQVMGRSDGLTKWVVSPDERRILGCGIVGTGAGELIGEAVLAIEQGCSIDDIAHVIHPHPTLSESLGGAADLMLGAAIEIYKPKRR